MLLSTTTGYYAQSIGDAEAIRLLKNLGFDAFDISMCGAFQKRIADMDADAFRAYCRSLREVADDIGIPCNQAHAPFASSTGVPEEDARIFDSIVQAMEGAAILGAQIIVVHPKQHLEYPLYAEELQAMNLEFYRRLIPYCEQFGIRVACENMWHYNRAAGRIIDSTCSRPAEFCAYIDAIGSPWVVGCLDVGHTALTDENLPKFVRMMGNKRLLALHVHDNDLRNDNHTLPYTGNIDFAPFLTALAEIGYTGDLTFEADNFLYRFPDPLKSDASRLMHAVGRYMIAKFEAEKQQCP